MEIAHINEETADEYAIGALDPALGRLVVLHAADCRPCRVLIARSEETAAALALALPSESPSPRVRRRVQREIGIGRPGVIVRVARRVPAAAAVASVAVAIVAFTGMVLIRDNLAAVQRSNAGLQVQVDEALNQQVEIATLQQRLSDEELRTFELATAARGDRELLSTVLSDNSQVVTAFTPSLTNALGVLVWDPTKSTLYFVADGIYPRQDGRSYQIWVNESGTFRSLGTFEPDDTGFVRYKTRLPEGIDGYQSAIVTLEREGGADTRTGPSVFVTDLSRLTDPE